MSNTYSKIKDKSRIVKFMVYRGVAYHYKITDSNSLYYYKSDTRGYKMQNIRARDFVNVIARMRIGMKDE